MEMIIAYIAHPIGGDVAANMAKLQTIVRRINANQPHVVPFVPYAMDVMAMDDNIPAQRQRGIANTIELFNRGFMDQLWLYGHGITRGMADEIDLAHTHGIPVLPQTRETFIEYVQRWGDGDVDGAVMRMIRDDMARVGERMDADDPNVCAEHHTRHNASHDATDDECDALLDLVGAPPDHHDPMVSTMWEMPANIITADQLNAMVENMAHDDGMGGCTYGDTPHDSVAVCHGYNMALDDVLANIKRITNQRVANEQFNDRIARHLDAVGMVNRFVDSLGDPVDGNAYEVKPVDGRWWIEHRHVGSGEPFGQWIMNNVCRDVHVSM